MKRFLVSLFVTVFVALLVTVLVFGLDRMVQAHDPSVTAILDKALKALGRDDKPGKIKAFTWKAKGKMILTDNQEYDFTGQRTTWGVDHFRSEREIKLRGTKVRELAVLNGDKAWHSFGIQHLQPDVAVAHLKRAVYLAIIPVTLAPLKGQAFMIKAAGEEKVGGRLAVVLRVTCPDAVEIAISFDKENGLPVRAVGKVFTPDGPEVTEETTYGDYKDFGGIKAATRIESKIDGKPAPMVEVTDFKVLDTVDPLALAVPIDPADQNQEASTVPGPETDKLLPATTGYMLFALDGDQPDGIAAGDIVAVQLPTLKDTIVRPTTRENDIDTPNIHSSSGPDAEGRIAYIEDHFFVADMTTRRHLLKTIRLDGTNDTEVFSRPGAAMSATSSVGHGEIGSDLALSPVGGRVAFLSGLVNNQMPAALLHVGSVEIWDVEKKTGIKKNFKALEGLAWFPDGKRLAYVKFVARELAAASGLQTDTSDKPFKGWSKVPAVFVRDVDAETESFLHVGWQPVVCSDGQSVLVSDSITWKRVDVATGKSVVATWPGMWMPIASPTRDVVLSLCLPTKGANIRFTKHNSPLVGPKEMLSLKLAKVNTNEFQTVVSSIDPRTPVSFGQVRQKDETSPHAY